MVRRVTYFTELKEFYSVSNISAYQSNDCPKENIIYTFKTKDTKYPTEFWKISLDLLNNSTILGFYIEEHGYVCTADSPLDEKGYAILQFENKCPHGNNKKNYLVLALLYHKIKFSFNNISIQNIFNELSEEEQDNYPHDLDMLGLEEIPELNTDGSTPEITSFFDLCVDDYDHSIIPVLQDFQDWNECFIKVDRLRKTVENKWKKIRSNFKRRETNYRARGYEILSGRDALKAIENSKTHSLVAIDTVEWTALEFNSITWDYNGERIDFYTLRKLIHGKVYNELRSSTDIFFMEDMCDTKWAVRDYHTGIRGIELKNVR
jgi:hypothetical protein